MMNGTESGCIIRHKEDQSCQTEHSALHPIIADDSKEIQHLQDLGLGRGIDSTDPDMWLNKSPWQLREIRSDCSNVIGNYDGGIKFDYETLVSSVRTQQSKIQSSLNVPSSKLSIGLDAHYSQKRSSTVCIAGTKVKTRTISFRFDFDDLPKPSLEGKVLDTFENGLSGWIISKIIEQKQLGMLPKEPEIDNVQEGENAVDRLDNFLGKIISVEDQHILAVANICKYFLIEFGLTHYVRAISLGALNYSDKRDQRETRKLGLGSNLKIASIASAGGSASLSTDRFQQSKERREIGRYDKDGFVRRNTHDEQVIGFEIEPVSKLIRSPRVHIAMRLAIDNYIQSKADNTFGPFLISTQIDDVEVYWKAAGDVVKGTADIKKASLFYCVSGTESHFDQKEFNIVYFGDGKSDRAMIHNIDNPISRRRSQAPLVQRFLTADKGTLFGKPATPLQLKHVFDVNRAGFSIFKRKRHSFACFQLYNDVSTLNNWLDGDEYFLKQISHSFLSTNSFVAMKKEEGYSTGEVSYTAAVVSGAQESENIGLLFRLHPSELRDNHLAKIKQQEQECRPQSDDPQSDDTVQFLEKRDDDPLTEERTLDYLSEEKVEEDEIIEDDPQGDERKPNSGASNMIQSDTGDQPRLKLDANTRSGLTSRDSKEFVEKTEEEREMAQLIATGYMYY